MIPYSQKTNFREAISKQVEIENKVKNFLGNEGIPTIYTNYYILCIKKIAKLIAEGKYSEVELVFNKWAGRDIDWAYLRLLIRREFNKVMELRFKSRKEGCVLYTPLILGTGTFVKDMSKEENNGTISGALWDNGIIGKCLYFDGHDDRVIIPRSTSLEPTQAMSIECWFKHELTGGDSALITKTTDNNWNDGYQIRVIGGKIHFWVNHYALGFVNADYTKGKWYHVVGTYDSISVAPKLKIYLNGILANSKDYAGSINNSSKDLVYGCSQGAGGSFYHHYNGRLDEIRIYNRALTNKEVAEHYEAEKPA